MGDHVVVAVESDGVDIIDSAPVNHKDENSCAEADLHEDYNGCQKNPGHWQFIPLKDIKIDHLPSEYRDKLIVDFIRAEANLTCLLSVTRSSDSRPKFYPGTKNPYPFSQAKGCRRTGTGWVRNVYTYKKRDKRNCECKECGEPGTHTPKKVWAKVQIITACHVVCNSEEAKHTTCYFFYDESTTKFRLECPTLTGLEVIKSDIMGDICIMTCASHDMDLVIKLVKMYDLRLEIFEKVRGKYDCLGDLTVGLNVSCIELPSAGHIIVISHPHGCCKHISIGEWTCRREMGKTKTYIENSGLEAEYIYTSYMHNAATCPGSSGAPGIRLLERGRVNCWWLLESHPHSRRAGEKDNVSGMMREYISCRPPPVKKWSKQTITLTALASFVVLGLYIALGLAVMIKWHAVREPLVIWGWVLCLLFWRWWWTHPYEDRSNLLYTILFILSLGLPTPFFLLILLGVNRTILFSVLGACLVIIIAMVLFGIWWAKRQKRQTVLKTQRSLRELTSRPCSRDLLKF